MTATLTRESTSPAGRPATEKSPQRGPKRLPQTATAATSVAQRVSWLERRSYIGHTPSGPGQPSFVDATTLAGDLWLHADDVLMTPVLVQHGFWEPELGALMERYLKPGQTFVDIGANIGYFAVLAGRLVGPDGWIVAVEPDSDNLVTLTANLWRNGNRANTTIVPAAAYSHSGAITLLVNEESRAACVVKADAQEGEGILVPCTTVDDLPLERPIDMLKIDAEGSDLEVLRGARKALAASPDPTVIVEIWTEFEPEEMLGHYKAEGFELHLIAGDGEMRRVSMDEALDAGSTVTYMNVALRRP